MSHHHCHCCACHDQHPSVTLELPGVSRRQFLFGVGALTMGGIALSPLEVAAALEGTAPARLPRFQQPLKVLPVLTYDIPQRREATSWRNWGGIQKEADVKTEQQHIEKELAVLKSQAEFPIEFLPVACVTNLEQAAAAIKPNYDLLIMYAAGGGGNILEAMTKTDKWNLMFLRHDSGPVYLWYEIAHNRFLRKTVDEYGQPGFDVHDVVVDSQPEILWRLRSLYGLKNAMHKRIVAIGGAGGWGAGGSKAPANTKSLWKMDLVDFPYAELAPRIKGARNDAALVKRCQNAAQQYLRQSGVTLHTTREFVNNAFVLCEVFKDLMDEARTDALTINSCMGTIMPMSETTACLPLSLLNDDGYLAFCESDFVVIPSGVLLHYISGKPVFLNDPTYPHDKVVTLAHCTAPRKMDGTHYEKTKILTHFESDYGAAPKVEMKIGQRLTNLVPDFASHRWMGFAGTVVGNPFLDICRSQIDVRIDGDGDKLLEEMKGFHWMTCYGDYRRETGFALKKAGIGWLDVSAPKA